MNVWPKLYFDALNVWGGVINTMLTLNQPSMANFNSKLFVYQRVIYLLVVQWGDPGTLDQPPGTVEWQS